MSPKCINYRQYISVASFAH